MREKKKSGKPTEAKLQKFTLINPRISGILMFRESLTFRISGVSKFLESLDLGSHGLPGFRDSGNKSRYSGIPGNPMCFICYFLLFVMYFVFDFYNK